MKIRQIWVEASECETAAAAWTGGGHDHEDRGEEGMIGGRDPGANGGERGSTSSPAFAAPATSSSSRSPSEGSVYSV
jgi:hypothetical protein